MATSYANWGGSGNRATDPAVTVTSTGSFNGSLDILLDGSQSATGLFFNGTQSTSGITITFDFGTGRTIDEATWYQSNTVSHGTWQWRGSSDNSTWTSIGGTFTLGSSATQVLSTLSGNAGIYRYYQLQGISGSTSTSPWLYEIEFKIDAITPPATSYTYTGGTGDRSSIITVTSSGTFESGSHGILINGIIDTGYFFTGAAASGKALIFDFGVGSSKAITEVKWYQNNTVTHGVWKWQGSNDASTWTDVGSSFTLGGGNPFQRQTSLAGNTTGYRYYKLLGVSGTTSSSPWLMEVEFQIGGATGGAVVQPCFFICM